MIGEITYTKTLCYKRKLLYNVEDKRIHEVNHERETIGNQS